jgi:hypothetical protein
MLRLSVVFLALLASTGALPEESEAEQQESIELAWLEGDARQRAILESAERDWYHYRLLTDTNVRTILPADECGGAGEDQGRAHPGGDPR